MDSRMQGHDLRQFFLFLPPPPFSFRLTLRRTDTMEDGSINKAMDSAAAYSGSTNPGNTFK